MRYFFVCVIVTLLILGVFPGRTLAVDKLPEVTEGQTNEALNNLTPVRFLPNNPLYYLIRGKEIISRLFQPSFRERAHFDYTIASKRLKEAYLLAKRGDLRKVGKALDSYIKTQGKIKGQLEKARSQNQDITVMVDKISDNLRFQEIILSALGNLKDLDNFNYGRKSEDALVSFGDFILYLEKIKPGVKSRFQVFSSDEPGLKTPEIDIKESSESSSTTNESSTQAKPRRIIF